MPTHFILCWLFSTSAPFVFLAQHRHIYSEYNSSYVSAKDSFVGKHRDIRHRYIQEIGIHTSNEPHDKKRRHVNINQGTIMYKERVEQ